MIDRPGQWPDITILPHDIPKRFTVQLRDEQGEIDFSASTVSVILSDNGIELGSLAVDITDSALGIIWITVDQVTYDAIGRYATWRLRESPYFQGEVALQGRIVKAAA